MLARLWKTIMNFTVLQITKCICFTIKTRKVRTSPKHYCKLSSIIVPYVNFKWEWNLSLMCNLENWYATCFAKSRLAKKIQVIESW